MQELSQCVLGEVISRVRRPLKPQFRLLVIGENAPTIPPALAQLMSGYSESSVPEPLQHSYLFRFFFLCVFIFQKDFFRILIGFCHLPPG